MKATSLAARSAPCPHQFFRACWLATSKVWSPVRPFGFQAARLLEPRLLIAV